MGFCQKPAWRGSSFQADACLYTWRCSEWCHTCSLIVWCSLRKAWVNLVRELFDINSSGHGCCEMVMWKVIPLTKVIFGFALKGFYLFADEVWNSIIPDVFFFFCWKDDFRKQVKLPHLSGISSLDAPCDDSQWNNGTVYCNILNGAFIDQLFWCKCIVAGLDNSCKQNRFDWSTFSWGFWIRHWGVTESWRG